MPTYYPGKGNVATFQKEVGELLKWATYDKPTEVIRKIALDLRDQAERTTPVGVDYTYSRRGGGKRLHRAGMLKEGWTAGVGLRKDRQGGSGTAKTEVAAWKPGLNLYVYNKAFHAWFIEHGWIDRRGGKNAHHPGRHILRLAVAWVVEKYRNVNLGEKP